MPDTVIARFTFKPDRAPEFSENGHEIVEVEVEDVSEIIEFCEEFKTAILDVQALVNGRTISLSDFTISA